MYVGTPHHITTSDCHAVAAVVDVGGTQIQPTAEMPCLHRRIDLRILPTENYWCGLLHFTGSDFFNRQMRIIALERGYTLSEYAICPIGETGVKGDPLPVTSEQDIFSILDLEYREPSERNL
jgi:DNA polymerase beta